MCSGRIDPEFIIKAFLNKIDGVFIGGCRLNECNYTTHGNYHALNITLLLKKIMEYIGLNPERLKIDFMSSGEGNLFAEIVNNFTNKIKEIGPIGKAEKKDPNIIEDKLKEISKLIPYIKIAKKEKLETILKDPSQYEDFFTAEEIERLFADAPSYYITPNKCKACGICVKQCPVDAIDGAKNIIHIIDQGKCIKCGTCIKACPKRFDAIEKIIGADIPPPITEAKRKIIRKSKKKK